MEDAKLSVKDFWNEASCGEDLYLKGENDEMAYTNQALKRYELEPYIIQFADFDSSSEKKILEIGVGLGADHQKFAEAGADLYGIDLTERAIQNTKVRLAIFNLHSKLATGDAEQLMFENDSFDVVYSWGVIHHSPNTPQAVKQIHRILKKGGEARIMIYHKQSFVGYMLWVRYALFTLKPFTSLSKIYDQYLESPGTKAYSIKEGYELFSNFSSITIDTILTHGDLLTSAAGQRHEGIILSIARKLFPRIIIRKLFPKHGLFMLIKAVK